MGLLTLEGVTRRFGGIVALDDLSLEVVEGEISGLIGPNGAGKTTAFNVITRLYQPDDGAITFDGKNLLKVPAHGIVRLGIARTFQNLALCQHMTVIDNVLVGAHTRIGRRGDSEAREEAHAILDYLGLSGLGGRYAAGLPFGTLKRVELARALISHPRLLLLDEPAGGLTHAEVTDLGVLIRTIRADYSLSILLVEHHMNLVMSISDRVHVLNFGRTIAEGTPLEVQLNPAVIEAYLGGEHAAA
jgi:branched-chain amino acid transport system ATP-binding protein